MRDLRLAARLLAKERGFTAFAVLVLGLGLGVNTTVFTIINGMNLRSLPVPHPRQILALTSVELEGRRQQTYTSYADFRDWQTATRTFSGLAAYASAPVNIGDEQRPADRVGGWFVTANTFAVLRVTPLIGRVFSAEDDRPGAPRVTLLAHGLWRARYGADPQIVGRSIRINGTPATVVGVMPPDFQFPIRAELWQPAAQHPTFDAVDRRRRSFNVFGRLNDGRTLEEARAEMASIAAALGATHPDTNRGMSITIAPFTEEYGGSATDAPPMLLMAAGLIVLVIACANAANLLLARAAYRRRDIALRVTLGAPRLGIVRLLLAESVLLALLAGIAGLALSVGAVRLFAAEAADLNLPYWVHFGFDAPVFAYVAMLSLGTAIAFGLAPAWQLSRTRAHDVLKDGGRSTAGPRTRRWTGALLVSELALTVTLLAGAGLLVRSSAALYQADAVVDLDNLLTGQLAIPGGKYFTVEARQAFVDRLQEQFAAAPGVSSATLASARPFVDASARELVIEGDAPAEGPRRVQMVAVGDRYFETLQLPVRGRPLVPSDGLPGNDAVVVNERFAAVYFSGVNPIGRRIQLSAGANSPPAPWLTVVGVSPAVRQQPMGAAAPLVYLPLRSVPPTALAVVVRGDSSTIPALLRSVLHTVDPDVAVYNVEPLRRLSEKSRWTPRLISTFIAIFGAIATLLSAAGLYAVTAYGIAQGTAEIGLRLALGAQRSQVVWVFLRRTLIHLAIGLAIGMAGAAAIGQVIRGVFVRTATTDPALLGTVVLVLVLTAAAACVIPARRAMRLDPSTALRRE